MLTNKNTWESVSLPLLKVVGDTKWRSASQCIGADSTLFFASGKKALKALELCRECTVREQCLQFAIDNDILYGIYGGMTEDERREFRKIQDAVGK